jgi:hypothetical protein
VGREDPLVFEGMNTAATLTLCDEHSTIKCSTNAQFDLRSEKYHRGALARPYPTQNSPQRKPFLTLGFAAM